MSGCSIEPLSDRDYDALIDLWRAAGLSHRPAGRDARQALVAQMALPGSRFFGVRGSGGELVGSAIATHDGRKGWINRLAVRPGARRAGLARALIAACEGWLHASGIGIIAALVEGDNGPSQGLFSACGYERDDTLVYLRKVSSPDV